MKENNIILQYKTFRVAKIAKVRMPDFLEHPDQEDSFVHLPASEGLAIEAQCDDKGHYVVIAFVKPTEDGECMYESVGSRIEEYCPTWNEVVIFRRCLAVAIDEIKSAIETTVEE